MLGCLLANGIFHGKAVKPLATERRLPKYTTYKIQKGCSTRTEKGKLVCLPNFSVYLLYRICKILKEAAPCMYITLLVWRRRRCEYN